MSFYRSLIVAVAAMGLATSVLAADENATTTNTETTTQTETAAQAPADASQATADSATTAAATDAKVDLNKATAKDLAKVKGLNAAKAKAIISYRKAHGDFKSVEDLKEVKGFKKMNATSLQKIEDQLTIG